jgi:hypothetical protein
MRRTAEPLKLKLHQFGVREPDEFEAAFAEMASKRIGALVVIDDAILIANAQTLAQCQERRWCLLTDRPSIQALPHSEGMYAGSRLKLLTIREGTDWKASLWSAPRSYPTPITGHARSLDLSSAEQGKFYPSHQPQHFCNRQ